MLGFLILVCLECEVVQVSCLVRAVSVMCEHMRSVLKRYGGGTTSKRDGVYGGDSAGASFIGRDGAALEQCGARGSVDPIGNNETLLAECAVRCNVRDENGTGVVRKFKLNSVKKLALLVAQLNTESGWYVRKRRFILDCAEIYVLQKGGKDLEQRKSKQEKGDQRYCRDVESIPEPPLFLL